MSLDLSGGHTAPPTQPTHTVSPSIDLTSILNVPTPKHKTAASQDKPYGNLLVVGSGGREHAIVWKLTQSTKLSSASTVYVAPGNGGTATIGSTTQSGCTVTNLPSQTTTQQIIEFARDTKNNIQLVVVGPEDPLNDGLVDKLKQHNIPAFGPSQAASQIECDKSFSKQFMKQHGIATAQYEIFTKYDDAVKYLQSISHRVVVKASGLAAGKGVIIPDTTDAAIAAVKSMLVDNVFGQAGASVVIEEFLTGYEASVLAFSDGKTVRLMPAAQDHKRLLDFDRGLNTGGMGAFAPSPNVSAELVKSVETDIIQPCIDGLAKAGTPFVGVLYAGVLVSKGRPFALEYNCRFGDPETQVLLPLLDSDLIDVFEACVNGTLDQCDVRFKSGTTAVTVVAVSPGYPQTYPKGLTIDGCNNSGSDESVVFHAGTKLNDKQLVTNGGRVLAVTSLGDSLVDAANKSYTRIESIKFDGMYYRHDIGGTYHRSTSSEPLRIGVLGSTRGTDMQGIIDAIDAKMLNARIAVVISNKADSGILQRAQQHQIPHVHIESKGRTREQFDTESVQHLTKHNVDIVLLIGFMRIVSPVLIDRYYWRIMNVHPSLLPEFAGGMNNDVHAAVLAAKKTISGCTIHFVDNGAVDCGPIILQKRCDVEPSDTVDTLKSKVQALEVQAFIECIQMYDDSKQFLTNIHRSSYPPPKQLYKLYRKHGLTDAKTSALIQQTNRLLNEEVIDSIDTELCYYIQFDNGITAASLSVNDRRTLNWLLAETYEAELLTDYPHLKSADVVECGPRNAFTSAYSTNAVSICQNVGLRITRLERFYRYKLHTKQQLTSQQRQQFESLVHDRMTEYVLTKPLDTFMSALTNVESWTIVPLLQQGKQCLLHANTELGLAMDNSDIDFYYDLFVNKLKRNPTNVELFDISQSNSEHSRHWFFRGQLVVDGKPVPGNLMKLVKATLDAQPENSVIAFADNSSVIKGFETTTLEPSDVTKASSQHTVTKQRDLLLTAETHNFPSGVAPYPGAETGTGGRIRDTHATGRGSLVCASVTGYSVGNLQIPHYPLPWENKEFVYSSTLATPLQIELQASNGASDYGNKFGEPVVTGFTRSYGQTQADGTRREYIKPIMFSAGVGFLDRIHAVKGKPSKGMLVVKIGGPAYRIGMGGSAASSMMQGDNKSALDFNAVQRGDAEMENKLNRVVRACVELGDNNPIVSIHDQGAGGNCNVLKEIVEPNGGIVNVRAISVGDNTLSVLELWGAEYQESDALLIRPDDRPLFESICKRERCPVDFVGTVTDSGHVIVYDSTDNSTPVDLDLQAVLGNIPQKTFDLERAKVALKPLSIQSDLTVSTIIDRLFRLLQVGSKRFLTSKVDRSVTGLIAQQSCVGPLHTPLADVAVVATSIHDTHGVATAVGEQPIKGLINYAAMARLSVGEALTNIVFAACTTRQQIKCSANWMWAAKLPGEGAALYDTCLAMQDVMIGTGIAVDGGKDSLSMAARTDNNELVKAPGTLVITLYSPCSDITKTVTPDLKQRGGSTLLYINMSRKDTTVDNVASLGGSAFAQVYNQVGAETADMHDVQYFNKCWDTIQQLVHKRMLLAGHDISDGGLLTAVCEMAFAGNVGVDVQLKSSDKHELQLAQLFGEELGVVLEVDDKQLSQVQSTLQSAGVHAAVIGHTTANFDINVSVNSKSVLSSTIAKLRDVWEATSFELEKLQTNPACAIAEQQSLAKRTDPAYKLTYTPQPTDAALLTKTDKPRVAVIREEGSNGDREMIAALFRAGFDAWDVHMNDLLNGSVDISESIWRGVVFVGGFSYADVLDSAKGWAAVIKHNIILATQFAAFKARADTFSLGVCNGCQLMALLGWVGAVDDGAVNADNPPARFVHNQSGRYESRWVSVRIEDSDSILFAGMSGSVLGTWTAHGEGQAYFTQGPDYVKRIQQRKLVPMTYVDDSGEPTEQYPFNPNGSVNGIAGLVSPDGRHTALMPHAERCQTLWSWPYQPRTEEWRNSVKAECPWMTMFQNAHKWCVSNTSVQPSALSVDTSTGASTVDAIAAPAATHIDADKQAQRRQIITSQLSTTLNQTQLPPPLTDRFVGKVRDNYRLHDDLMVLVTTDRLSAFDRVLTDIPFKGAVLNQVAAYWFEATRHIIPNHYIASPHPNVTVAHRCKPFAVEVVVRGYITGTTSTSLWTHYNNGSRDYCGNVLPDGLLKNQKLAHNVLTPTTKAEDHDAPISGADIVKTGLMTADQWAQVSEKALKLFEFGQQTALQRGLLLVDTKYEFGMHPSGQIMLIDEIHTPDSSRYWIADTYEQRMQDGKEPDSIDKEFVRLWYRANCDPYKDATLPTPPQSLIVELSARYIQLYEMITGKEFRMTVSDTSVADEVVTGVMQWVKEYEQNDKQLPSAAGIMSPRTQLMENILGDMKL